mmetsp:Transcript_3993/g.11384  ORF Transcript_3993/g.11384 Transcript_3993/m.11384 type:complete len:1156 (+) Transcript_3993:1893-5360(+)
MGCEQSKESDAVSPAPRVESHPPILAHKHSAAPTSSGSSVMMYQYDSSASSQTPTNTTKASTPNKNHNHKANGNGNGSAMGVDGEEVFKTLKMVQLNDTVPSPGSGSGSGGGDDKRGRFLSYASGASTPNTSSGNLSWAGDASSDGKDGCETKYDETASSPGGASGGGLKPKNKLYKHKHTGSAIDLENMLNDQNITSLTSKVVHIEVPFGRPIEEVYDGVHSGPILGSGVSGIVRKVSHKKTGVEYAVKALDLKWVETKEGLEQLREEIFIMCQLDHPNIVRLEEVYESHSEIYLVQELCLGGELFDRLDEQPDYHYTEAECARLIKQMLCAVRYLHSKGIIHRDLKLENFLFSSSAPDSELKMIDFGLSKHFQYGEIQQQAVGTPYTVAPEVIRGRYDERCDIWAIGVIAFLLLSGDPPFGGCGGPEPLMVVRQNILDGAYEFEPFEIWDLVSDSAKEFIHSLLVTNPKFRPTASNAQKLPWLKEWAYKTKTDNDHILNPNVVRALVNFKEFSDMRKLLCEVLSFTLLPEQIKDLRKEFEIMDTDGTGEITLDNLKQVLVSNAEAGSLGALTEEEVVDIFNAMRVNKEETTIHWHEFIAAGLTQCRVDDRNLRLAFDRLDSDHKGYITLKDIVNLVGSEDMASEQEMRNMWTESMEHVGGNQDHITYDHFLLIMKGQTEKAVFQHHIDMELRPKLLESVPEVEDELPSPGGPVASETVPCAADADADADATADVPVGAKQLQPKDRKELMGRDEDRDMSHFLVMDGTHHSMPNMGIQSMFDSTSTISVEEGSSMAPPPAPNAVWPSPKTPKSPKVGGIGVDKLGVVPKEGGVSKALLKPTLTRKRSKSLETEPTLYTYPPQDSPQDFVEEFEPSYGHYPSGTKVEKAKLGVDTRRALNLPERHDAIHDELAKKSALAVNRELYRAHRRMRISVLEASRRFEEKQAIRARDTLMKEQMKEAMGAGLVMRHGTKLHVTSDAIRKYLDQTAAEQRIQIEKANRKGGRGRSRKKTISDMSAMLSPSMGQEELGDIAVAAAWSKTPDSKRTVNHYDFDGVEGLPDLSLKVGPGTGGNLPIALAPRRTSLGGSAGPVSIAKQTGSTPTRVTSVGKGDASASPAITNLPQIDHKALRKATVPGQFLKTEDPFGSSGIYGS